jgi:hypothetical protein
MTKGRVVGLKLSTVNAAVRTVDVPFLGEYVKVSYRVGAVNSQYSQWLSEHGHKPNSLLEAITRLATKWDLLGDDGEPLPLSQEALEQVEIPTPLLRAIHEAILEDARPGPLAGKSDSSNT